MIFLSIQKAIFFRKAVSVIDYLYRVEYGTDELINKADKAVNQMPVIKKAVIKTTKTALEFDDTGIVMETKASYTTALDGVFSIPDVLFYIQERTELTRSTILEILLKSERPGDLLINPQLFLDNAITAIKASYTRGTLAAPSKKWRSFRHYSPHQKSVTKAGLTFVTNCMLISGTEPRRPY